MHIKQEHGHSVYERYLIGLLHTLTTDQFSSERLQALELDITKQLSTVTPIHQTTYARFYQLGLTRDLELIPG